MPALDYESRRNESYLIPDSVNQTNHFFNPGYGWLCKHCSAEDAEHHEQPTGLWRLLQRAIEKREGEKREGEKREGEKKAPQLPNLVLARWTDAARRSLACPRCGIEEVVSRS